MTISSETYSSKAKAERRARELRRLSGGYRVRIVPDSGAWAVEYWQGADTITIPLHAADRMIAALEAAKGV